MSINPQILLSINVPTLTPGDSARSSARNTIIQQLASELEQHEFVATWILHDQRLDDVRLLTESISLPQEISLALSQKNQQSQPALFSRTLSDLQSRSRNLGVRITTLSTNHSIKDRNLRLLVKHRISMVNQHCGIHSGKKSTRVVEPNSLRFGIWEVPAPLQWVKQLTNPVRELVLKSNMHFKTPRAFQHIQIDIQAMLENNISILKIKSLLRALNRTRLRGKIDVTPIRSAATLLRHLQTTNRQYFQAA